MQLRLKVLQFLFLTCTVNVVVAEAMRAMSIVRNSITELIYIEIISSASLIKETSPALNGDKKPRYECNIMVNCRNEKKFLIGCGKGYATGFRVTARDGIPYCWMSSLDVVI